MSASFAVARAAAWLFPCLLSAPLTAQSSISPDTGGNGSDGPFAAAVNVLIDTNVQNVFQFTTFDVAPGVTVTVRGRRPLLVKVQGIARIDGLIDCTGSDGAGGGNNLPGGNGGLGGPGGGFGGFGGAHPSNPFSGTGGNGVGNSPGQGGLDGGVPPGVFTDPVGGGGGGGNATAGASGGASACCGPHAFSGAGGPAVLFCRTGAGGGGGGGDIDSATVATNNDGGGGGGGGGGRICLFSNTGIIIAATGGIGANGGRGGTSTGNGAGGGGGAGGMIELVAPRILNDGGLSAVGGGGGGATQLNAGGSPGGAGGDGCIYLFGALGGTGGARPNPRVEDWALELVPDCPRGTIDVRSGGNKRWFAGFSLSCLPAPIPLPQGNLEIGLDFLFNITFGSPALPPIFFGLSGAGPGQIGIDASLLAPFSPIDLAMYVQVFSFDPGFAHISNKVCVNMKF